MNIDTLFKSLKPSESKVVAVAAAEDDAVLGAVCAAHREGIATPILCGQRDAILTVASDLGLDISAFEIVEAPDPIAAAKTAVSLVRAGRAQLLMKGKVGTADLLRAVLNKEQGLRSGNTLTHVGIVHSPILDRILLLTDAAIVTYPDLRTKVELINSAVKVAKGLGIDMPRVAALAAVEVVNPDMPATLDAAQLTVMNLRGQIKGCIVDGPLAMDLALSEEAAAHKGIQSEVAGRANILLFHNIDAANNATKVFTHAGNCLYGGVVMGAAAPIVLTSRSDSEQSKLFSILCATSVC